MMNPMFIAGLVLAVFIIIAFVYFRGEKSEDLVELSANDLKNTRKLQFEDVFNSINKYGDRLYAWGGDKPAYDKDPKFNIGTASDADSNKILSTEWSKNYSRDASNITPLAFRSSFSQPYSMNKGPVTQVAKPLTINDIVSMPASVTKPIEIQTVVPAAPITEPATTAGAPEMMDGRIFGLPEKMMAGRRYGFGGSERMMAGRTYGPERMMAGRTYGPERMSRYMD
jgi:hypothetical protein